MVIISQKWDIILGLCLLVLAMPWLILLLRACFRLSEKEIKRMKSVEASYGYRGEWRDCGDGTALYIIDGVPVIESLTMLDPWTSQLVKR